eukprot:2405_1
MSSKNTETPTITITKADVAEIHFFTVYGYIRSILAITTIAEDIIDLITFFYAKPIVVNLIHNNQIQNILYDILEDSWISIYHKIRVKCKLRCGPVIRLYHKSSQNPLHKLQSLEWNDNELLEVVDNEQLSLLWKSPRITVQMISEFLERLPVSHMEIIWKRHSKGEYIPKNKIPHLLHSLIALCIKFKDSTVPAPSRYHIEPKILPFATIVTERIENLNGMTFDELKNKFPSWLMQSVTGLNMTTKDAKQLLDNIEELIQELQIQSEFEKELLMPLRKVKRIQKEITQSISIDNSSDRQSLLFQSPIITIQMFSEFICRLPVKHKESVWNQYAIGQYIPKKSIFPMLRVFVSLLIRIKDRTEVKPSLEEFKITMYPFVCAIKQKIKNENGMSSDEFYNQLQFWLLEHVSQLTISIDQHKYWMCGFQQMKRVISAFYTETLTILLDKIIVYLTNLQNQ